jgi:hypothetical protein
MIDDARGEAPAIERDQKRDSQVERHRTRMALGKDRDRLSQIIDGSPVPTFVIDEDHRVHPLEPGVRSHFEGFKGRVATYIERIQFRREAPWTRSARTAKVSI